MDDEPQSIPNLPCLVQTKDTEAMDEVEFETFPLRDVHYADDYEAMNEAAFKAHSKVNQAGSHGADRTALQVLINNRDGWELEYCKGGLKYLIGELNEKTAQCGMIFCIFIFSNFIF